MGSGGSSSKSSSADYNWPSYMKNAHSRAMGDGNFSKNVTRLISEAIDSNPYDDPSFITYEPSYEINNINTYLCHLHQIVEQIIPETDYRNFVSIAREVSSDITTDPALVDAATNAHRDILYSTLEHSTLPLYRRGVQNISAQYTSAFKLGEAYLYREVNSQVASFDADMRWKLAQSSLALVDTAISSMLQLYTLHIQSEQDVVGRSIDFEKTSIQAMTAYHETYNANLTGRGIWGLEATKYFAEIMRSIMGGGTASNQAKKDPVLASLGGGITGAATGALVGSAIPGVGTAAGAIGGGLLGIATGGAFGLF